ncbi:copper-binding protein [Chrysiogenes arsenatis]|uniref:copper-binding protein n=1 Tax=Chrysiogenes arsenatis TaxID=309797 RepID=UPI0003F71C29|nr:copper-binding protein [Chrysiogenes arsenatis]
MKKIVTTTLVVATLAFGTTFALASSHGNSHGSTHGNSHGSSHGTSHGATQKADKKASVQAEILGIAADGKSVDVDHAPIREFGWPAMQMSLELQNANVAKDIAVGDKVMLEIKQKSATEYVITKITKQ